MVHYAELIKNIIVNRKKAHVFVVDKYSLPVHVNRLVAAVKYPRNEWGFSGRWGLISCLKVLREGDFVLFYQRRINESYGEWGFRGIFKIIGAPYFDTQDIILQVDHKQFKILGKCPICGNIYPEEFIRQTYELKCSECGNILDGHILPYRVPIEPVEFLDGVITDNRAYIDKTLPGDLWTMLFRKVYGKGRERSVTVILPEESIRLLHAFESEGLEPVPEYSPYAYVPSNTQHVNIRIQGTRGGRVKYEHILQAWISENIDNPDVLNSSGLGEILEIGNINEIEWFGNEILYGIGGDRIDFLILYKQDGIRYKATVIELKRDVVSFDDLRQVERYTYWVSQLVTSNTDLVNHTNEISPNFILQPILIGFKFKYDVIQGIRARRSRNIQIDYSKGSTHILVKPPIGVKYKVCSGTLVFQKII